MAVSKKNTDPDQGNGQDGPTPGVYRYTEGPPLSGREYGKELLAWTRKQVNVARKQLYPFLLRLVTRIPQRVYNGVDTKELNRRMQKINWNKDYYSTEAIARGQRSPRFQRKIMQVNSILRDLQKLSESDHYKAEELRWKLQHKYWTGTRMQQERGNTLTKVLPAAHYFTGPRMQYPATNLSNGNQKSIAPAISQPMNAETKQQENAARRKRIAAAGASLLSSWTQRSRKPKKGMGL